MKNNRLIVTPIDWVREQQQRAKMDSYMFIGMWVSVTILAALIPFIIVMITQISLLDPESKKNVPDWYAYVPLLAPSIIAYLAALIGAFAMQERYRMAFKNSRFIRAEMLLFEHGVNEYAKSNEQREVLLANKIAMLTGFAKE